MHALNLLGRTRFQAILVGPLHLDFIVIIDVRFHLMNGAAATEKGQETILDVAATRNLVAFFHERPQLHDKNDHKNGVNERTKEAAKEHSHGAEDEVDNGVHTASVRRFTLLDAVDLPIVAHAIEQLSKGNAGAAQGVPKDALLRA